MPAPFRYLGQGLVYAAIAVLFGTFATWPAYRHSAPDTAKLTLSLAHSGSHAANCRRLTAKEIAALPPQERRPSNCARERLPVVVEIVLNGETIVSRSIAPSGLFGDGPSQVYENFEIPPGPHTLAARLRDSARAEGFDYVREAEVEIAPGERFVIEFRAETGGFQFRAAAPPAGSLERIMFSRNRYTVPIKHVNPLYIE